jgi:hypothetical protein
MNEKIAKKGKLRLSWWLLLLIIFLCLLVYFFRAELAQDPTKEHESQDPSETQVPPATRQMEAPSQMEEEQSPVIVKGKVPKGRTALNETTYPIPPPVDPCAEAEEEFMEFFPYLDQKEPINKITRGHGTFSAFKRILTRLAARPPVPAGEGRHPRLLAGNLYHFFRALRPEDFRLIRYIARHEQDTIELSLMIGYRWLMLGDICPDSSGVRPSFDITYRYAGFFLNTTGGRAYLLRRSWGLRLLIRYYCVLILHKSNEMNKNNYGIDVLPFIDPLMEEMRHYPDFRFQEDYLENLKEIRSDYSRSR